ncbi:helix-turn-helix domain containing protein [Solwaraspora sp. WMMD406]|uniref:TetR/AcrR family transcriptional regulator n=1 Tax=Solwaraspora sp. WMMD406 TaxID=3016095 RepID=UPI0024180855|nr:TetR/AcrR family transcriptional regulator [Solwaraspora sp. WMMD406]MDG4767705.1 helix-turn-helix domain containing protein [Solwaraspora sp. WMMD406]
MTSSSSSPQPRQMRADAQRNRVRILAAAEQVFAAAGPSASTEDLAELAGVAIGTVFRHFPTKAALIEAVFVSRLREITAYAREMAAAADVGTGFFAFFSEAVRQSTVKHAFTDAIDSGDEAMAAVRAAIASAGTDLRDAMGDLLTRAQESGAVRPDIATAELIGLMIGTARALEQIGSDQEGQQRILAVLRDGLRPRPDLESSTRSRQHRRDA